MIKALFVLGLLGAGQAFITSQTRARRRRLAGSVDARSLQSWEDEGGAVSGTPGATASGIATSQVPRMGAATGTSDSMGAYPAAGQAG